jgi:hypothetical protein
LVWRRAAEFCLIVNLYWWRTNRDPCDPLVSLSERAAVASIAEVKIDRRGTHLKGYLTQQLC